MLNLFSQEVWNIKLVSYFVQDFSHNFFFFQDLSTLLEFVKKQVERINESAKTLIGCSEKNVIQTLNPKGKFDASKNI